MRLARVLRSAGGVILQRFIMHRRCLIHSLPIGGLAGLGASATGLVTSTEWHMVAEGETLPTIATERGCQMIPLDA